MTPVEVTGYLCDLWGSMGNRWLLPKGKKKIHTGLYSTFTDFSTGGTDWPCWEFCDEIVAHIQNFQFLSFTQPVWQGLHTVPAGREWLIVVIDYVQFVKQDHLSCSGKDKNSIFYSVRNLLHITIFYNYIPVLLFLVSWLSWVMITLFRKVIAGPIKEATLEFTTLSDSCDVFSCEMRSFMTIFYFLGQNECTS